MSETPDDAARYAEALAALDAALADIGHVPAVIIWNSAYEGSNPQRE